MINIEELNAAVKEIKNTANEFENFRITFLTDFTKPNGSVVKKVIYVAEFNKASKDVVNKTGKFSKWFLSLVNEAVVEAVTFRIDETTLSDNFH